jgi:Domain of unknown function (DUF6894)
VRVPRYYFHFSDGTRRFTDSSGHELSGLRAARAHAVKDIREIKAALCARRIEDLSAWSMTVADARGKPVFVLGFDLKPRPDDARARRHREHAQPRSARENTAQSSCRVGRNKISLMSTSSGCSMAKATARANESAGIANSE